MKTTIALNLLIGLWLLVVIPGLFYSISIVRRADAALAWLRMQNLNGYREIVARGAIYRGQIRVFIFACMVLMGLLAAATQLFEPGSDQRSVISGVFRLLFIAMAMAYTYKAWLEQHELDLLTSEDQRRTARTRVGDVQDG